MNNNQNIIIKLYETFDRGDFKAVKDLLSENFVAHLVGMSATLDRDKFTEFGTKFRQAFPNGHHNFDRPIAEDDRVVTCGHLQVLTWATSKAYQRQGEPSQLP